MKIKIAVAIVTMTLAVPAVVYCVRSPAGDPLADRLQSYGFYPINPPSTLVDVGSLYYVSEDGREYTAICLAERADIEGVVHKSRSLQIEEDLRQNGSFASNISVSFRSLVEGGGGVADNYVQKVHFSLTDTMLEEISLESNLEISDKLMHRSECNAAVVQLLSSSGYVCQGQKILLATAEFKLDRDSQNKLTTGAKIAPEEVNEALKTAIETQSDQSVVERDGRLYSGSALNYGVEVNPTCLAPIGARFKRVLPRTALDRFINFVSYRIVEPWLPPTSDEAASVAQVTRAETR